MPLVKHPAPIRAFNGLGALAERMGWLPGRASGDRLVYEAMRRTGLSDFGDPAHREGLERLVDLYNRPGKLSLLGRLGLLRMAVRILVVRLRTQRWLGLRPEILDRKLSRPVFIVGLPRTGTTHLLKLLACDPAHRPLRYWEASYPTPPEGPLEAPGVLKDSIRTVVRLESYLDPGMQALHPHGADEPEECVVLLANTFRSVQFYEGYLSPYREWYEATDPRPAYHEYATWLRMLDWQRPGERWLLKSPVHLRALDVLAELFPDACVIQTHRHPVQCIPSACSLVARQGAFFSNVDPREIGRVVPDWWAGALERGLAAREKTRLRVADVFYPDLLREPLEVVRSIYRAFDLPLSDVALRAMTAYLRASLQHERERHVYDLGEFGLLEGSIRERFGFYIRSFDLETQMA